MAQNEQPTTAVEVIEVAPVPIRLTPEAIEITKQNIALCEQLVSEVLEGDIDWGQIPGIAQPNLWDPGAAKIMAAFNCYPKYTVLNRIEEDNLISFTIESTLVNRQSRQPLATGIGACSTRETKYKYRWVFEDEAISMGLNPVTLKRKDKKYQVPNPERGELVNTIVKMAAKRADIDAAQSLPGVAATLRKLFKGMPVKGKEKRDWNWFWTQLRTMGVDSKKAHSILGVVSIKDDWVGKGKTLDAALAVIKLALAKEKPSPLKGDEAAWEALRHPTEGEEKPVAAATKKELKPKPKRDPSSIKTIDDLMKACKEDFDLGNIEVLNEANAGTIMDIVDPKATYLDIAAARQP